ncbi:MAG: DJ-1/PfpI family protein [Polyangiaceae bacterium]
MQSLNIGLLLFPRLTQLDLTGPHEVFTKIPDAKVHLVAETMVPVTSDSGLTILPTATLESAPPLDIICVPGGPGVDALLENDAVLTYVAAQGARTRWVTSVCTGALVLGAAGLLRGYRATTHWRSLDLLELVGAVPVKARVAVDRNRITGGGVTSGIDFALTLAALVHSQERAREIELMLEYAPQPPFGCGSPETADVRTLDAVLKKTHTLIEQRAALLKKR